MAVHLSGNPVSIENDHFMFFSLSPNSAGSSGQSTRRTVAIITPVTAVMVLFVVAIVILVVVWYWKCRTVQQFEFKPMSVTYSDLKERETAAEGDGGNATEMNEKGDATEKGRVENEYGEMESFSNPPSDM